MFRILVVDDNELVRHMYVLALRSPTQQVDAASTLGDARALLATEAFDLVVLDLSLPDGNGADFALELHEREPALPIVIASASIDAAVEARLGPFCAALVSKTASIAELRSAVSRALGPPRRRSGVRPVANAEPESGAANDTADAAAADANGEKSR